MSFAVEDNVRLLHGFSAETEFHNEVGTSIHLPTSAYSIISVERNGVLFTEGSGAGTYAFIKPKKITFDDTEPLNQDDFVLVTYATEIQPTVITEASLTADEDIRAILTRRFGEDVVSDWDTTTPVFIEKIATHLAGLYAERSMLRKGHVDPNELVGIDRQIDRLFDRLREVDLGMLDVPGEDPAVDEAIVGRGGDTIFADLDQIEGFDYHDYYRQVDKRNTSLKDF